MEAMSIDLDVAAYYQILWWKYSATLLHILILVALQELSLVYAYIIHAVPEFLTGGSYICRLSSFK